MNSNSVAWLCALAVSLIAVFATQPVAAQPAARRSAGPEVADALRR